MANGLLMPECSWQDRQTVWNKWAPETQAEVEALCTGPQQVLPRETGGQGKKAEAALRSPHHPAPHSQAGRKLETPPTLPDPCLKGSREPFRAEAEPGSQILLPGEGQDSPTYRPSSSRCKKVWLPRGSSRHTEKPRPRSTNA